MCLFNVHLNISRASLDTKKVVSSFLSSTALRFGKPKLTGVVFKDVSSVFSSQK